MFEPSRILFKIKQGILLFWTAWFAIAFLTNLTDIFKALGFLPEAWSLASGNWAFLRQVTAIYGTPVELGALLFFAVMVWEAAAGFLFWQALMSFNGRKGGLHVVSQSFAVSLALWAAFMLADEFFIAYELENTHRSYASFELLSLLAIYFLPDKDFETH